MYINSFSLFQISIPPAIHIQSGDTITFDCLDASNGQITPTTNASAISTLDLSTLDQVNGPVFVSSAQPGDTLQIEVLDVEVAEWGWTGIIPGFGLLADEFPEPELKIWTLIRSTTSQTSGSHSEGSLTGYGYAWFDEKKGNLRLWGWSEDE